jgi:hypothetical protein
MDVERRIWRWGPRANATTSPEESTDSDVPRGFNRLLAFPASNDSSKWIETLEILALTTSGLKGASPSRRESGGALEGPEVVFRQTFERGSSTRTLLYEFQNPDFWVNSHVRNDSKN